MSDTAVRRTAPPSAARVAELLGQHPPTAEQTAVIEADLGPLLVVAGAGSGKTETMAARVVWLVAAGLVDPGRVLGLTFTRKAAGELTDRVRLRLRQLRAAGGLPAPEPGTDPGEPTIATYHSYAASVVGDHGLRLGVEPRSRLLGEAAGWQLAQEVVEGWSADLAGIGLAPSTVVDALVALSAECAEHLVDPSEVGDHLDDLLERVSRLPQDDSGGEPARPARTNPVGKVLTALTARRMMVPLLEAYARRKRDLEALDFGDQVALAARLAHQVPDVGAGERARFDVVLLDEYQDTSHAQLELLRHLFGGGHPVTAVGDPHQSIYGWRGASAGNLDGFGRDFPRADGSPAPVAWLSTSWRNDRAVLDVANALADPLRVDAAVEVRPLAPRPQAGPGAVRASWFPTVEDEHRALAQELSTLWTAQDEDVARGAPRATMAVLCRKRSQFAGVERALRDAGLPVEVVGLGGLLDRPEVVDVVATLQVLHDASRGDALVRLLTGPRWRIGPGDLHCLGEWARALVRRTTPAPGTDPGTDGPAAPDPRPAADDPGPMPDDAPGPPPDPPPGDPPDGSVTGPPADDPDVVDERSIVDALDVLPSPGWRTPRGRTFTAEGHRRLSALAAELRRLRLLVRLPLADLVTEVERALLLDVEVAAAPGTAPAAARAQLDAFTDVAAAFSDTADRPTLGGFLSWLQAAATRERGLDLAEDEPDTALAPDAVEASHDAVQVLTVHAAKGLEWDVVAVPGLVEGSFPSGRSGKAGDTSSGWLSGLGTLPYDLRGDVDSLPRWAWRSAAHLKELEAAVADFRSACGTHEVQEERRLAYVAATRARHRLLLSGAWWQDGKTPRQPSRFLREVAERFSEHPAVRLHGLEPLALADGPAEASNPRLAAPDRATWPGPAHPAQPRARTAAQEVLAHLTRLTVRTSPAEPTGSPLPPEVVGPAGSPGPAGPAHRAAPGAGEGTDAARDTDADDVGDHGDPGGRWAHEVDRLLAERDRLTGPRRDVPLPVHLSASRLVELAADPAALAERIRRPMPVQPHPHTRRGTAFHAWLERRFRADALVDVEDLPGAMDDDAAPDEELPRLQETFLASEWAWKDPEAVEVDVETPVAGVVLRGRVDAVFRDGDGGFDVVDWKTGRPPTGDRARSVAVQLAVYRLAWSRLHEVPLERVRAAFFYASTGETVRPADLLDEAGLVRLITDHLHDPG